MTSQSPDLQLARFEARLDVIPIGPGRLLTKAYMEGGRLLGKKVGQFVHRMGKGPVAVAERIKGRFETSEGKVMQMVGLSDEIAREQEKDGRKLMKHALPDGTRATQLTAFKNLISLTTRFVGLRGVFLHCKHVQAVGTLKASVVKLWRDTDVGSPDLEWDFFLELAASCVCDEAKLAEFLEGKSVNELSRIPVDSGEYSTIERLLVASQSCDIFESCIAIRYLGGILESPLFWLQTSHSNHQAVTKKLVGRVTHLVNDLDVESPSSLNDDIRKSPHVDVQGIDSVASALLNGVRTWDDERWFRLPDALREGVRQLVELLCYPGAQRFLPQSYHAASKEWNSLAVTYQRESVEIVVTRVYSRKPSASTLSSYLSGTVGPPADLPFAPPLLVMNGDGAAKYQSQSLLSTSSPASGVPGAGSTGSPPQQSPDSTSPNPTRNLTNPVPNHSTSKINSPSESNRTIGDPTEGTEGHQEMSQHKGFQSAPEGGEPVDTEIIHSEAISNSPKDVYIRLNPLGIANTDLVDIFHADQAEKSVKTWLRGDGHAEIASKRVELKEEPLTTEQARFAAPPAPPPNVHRGYNPQLDEPRPGTITGYLSNYHIFFVIDDSGSMRGTRWSETRDALLEIADQAFLQNSEEVDIRFFNSALAYRGIKGADTVMSIFRQVEPRGRTPMGATLDKVLSDYISKLDATVNTPQYYDLKPLNIIVLTDGIPTDMPKQVLTNAVARMRAANHHPNSVGVQIVQIDDDTDAIGLLKDLMHGDVGSMVEIAPYDGVLTPKKLERILLGGLHPTVRAMLPV